jgi:hypothetical protein
MAIDYRVGTKVIKSLRKEDAGAIRVDPHPYIGIVKNNLDPARSGRLEVWIPDLGGKEEDSHNWRTISYASPFMGTTDIAPRVTGLPNTANKFRNVPHTYGMWMVPPDIGVEVIVIFIAGDPLRGYFIACVNSHVSRHMMPGLASSAAVDVSGADETTTQSYKPGATAPVAEYNENNAELIKNPNFINNPKPIHEPQYAILKNQGLDRDTARGTITSSSQRESPSNVFGISTPGRPYDNDPANDPAAYLAKVKAGTLTEDDYRTPTRSGGHTFVMDDGSVTGNNQLIRLRTATGHQIMMNDTEDTLYISHSNGGSWVELSGDGQVHIYSKAGFNVRSEGTVNIHSDTNINLNAINDININAGNKLEINAAGINLLSTKKLSVGANGIEFKSAGAYNIDSATVSVQSGSSLVLNGDIKQNDIGGAPVTAPTSLKSNSLPDVALGANGLYTQSEKLSTIVSVAPTHEPFNRGSKSNETTVSTPAPVGNSDPAVTPAYKRITGASTTLTDTNIRDQLKNSDGVIGEIGPLSKDEVVALLSQIAKSESSAATPMNVDCKVPRSYSPRLQNGKAGYEAINQCGFLGKYQMGFAALRQAGFVASHCKGTATLNNPSMWLNGLTRDIFLSTPAIQEQAIFNFTKANYQTLSSPKNRTITKDTSNEEIGGILMAAHMLGAGGARTFARTGEGVDINNGTSGAKYYALGRAAVAIFGPKIAELRLG